jgi:hypothetical protein
MNAAPKLSLTPAPADRPVHPHLELFAALGELRNRLHEKYERALPGRTSLVRQAVSEAEALAWQTPFPHLFLPDLAELRIAQALGHAESAYAHAA